MAAGETSGPSQGKQVVSSSAARNKASNDKEESEVEELTPLVQADPELKSFLMRKNK